MSDFDIEQIHTQHISKHIGSEFYQHLQDFSFNRLAVCVMFWEFLEVG